jgi:NTP pyrophosphatase (non-canonical NTP hydrolase)
MTMAPEFDFTGTALELCARKGCCHYRGEHSGPGGYCTAPGRMADGVIVPGTTCICDGFAGTQLVGAVEKQLAATRTSDGHHLSRQQIAQHGRDRYPTVGSNFAKVLEELGELGTAIFSLPPRPPDEWLSGGMPDEVRKEYADVGLALHALGDKLGLDLIAEMRSLVEADTRKFE